MSNVSLLTSEGLPSSISVFARRRVHFENYSYAYDYERRAKIAMILQKLIATQCMRKGLEIMVMEAFGFEIWPECPSSRCGDQRVRKTASGYKESQTYM
ncbi:hypothetical protein GE21DRAFT_205 [Neurospora crassa]|uniref:Uncharacterized protein n=1 Tax=Neurospora crassa (strain ATCC 24698 / 74-OR23-1A / CBS 708.71 / DSM 1257 / FGSC 987) TaxID=367110 RepID=Q7SFS0_NEUCR|nr:hypothetical protein NCU09080 [Neurospora crassa OR74A]EAA35661.1 hypothetical protein NCU09080 [Neurospora crassa OR74A]KHE82447.1 hypothetical protein GE21DRAFT_205 [Neurospora crassa]|eukprot:XP_964897.1 hypothetical protein NCU09080 [Neurospora crassa OR74A]